MAQYGEKAGVLYRWAARKFAGEDLKHAIRWDPSGPDVLEAASGTRGPGHFPRIKILETYYADEKRGKKRKPEELWYTAVYELYNITCSAELGRLDDEVAAGRLTKEEYFTRGAEIESAPADKTRSFYVNVFLPWAKEHREPTDPQIWYVGDRCDPAITAPGFGIPSGKFIGRSTSINMTLLP